MRGKIFINDPNIDSTIAHLTKGINNDFNDVKRRVEWVARFYDEIGHRHYLLVGEEGQMPSSNEALQLLNLCTWGLIKFVRISGTGNESKHIYAPDHMCRLWRRLQMSIVQHNIEFNRWSVILFLFNCESRSTSAVNIWEGEDRAKFDRFCTTICQLEITQEMPTDEERMNVLTDANIYAFYFIPISYFERIVDPSLQDIFKTMVCRFRNEHLNDHFRITYDKLPPMEF